MSAEGNGVSITLLVMYEPLIERQASSLYVWEFREMVVKIEGNVHRLEAAFTLS